MGVLRYLVPSALTFAGLLMGMLSMLAAHDGRFAAAGYFIIWAILLDNLDGPAARLLKGTSALGAQLDSLADAVNFGVAPAAFVYLLLRQAPGLGFETALGHAGLAAACLSWTAATMLRLARFNANPGQSGLLFGVPTTLASGTLVLGCLVMLKYAAAGSPLAAPGFFTEAHLLPAGFVAPTAWRAVPVAMVAGAALMISPLPMPKLGGIRNRAGLAIIVPGLLIGYACNMLRIHPEWMLPLPLIWLVYFIAWGRLSEQARGLRPAPFFPERTGGGGGAS